MVQQKELTPYRPSEWPLLTFQEKIHDPKFADYAYQAHTVVDQQLQLVNSATELHTQVMTKVPKTIKRLNIWGGADEYSTTKSGAAGALTLVNIFHNEEMFKGVLRAILLGEAVGYDESIKRLTECGTYLNTIGHYDEPDVSKKTEEGFLIEVAIQFYYQAVYVTDQHETTQTKLEQDWEEQHRPKNQTAYEQLLRHIPNNIQEIPSEEGLINLTTPQGDKLPKPMARRLFRKTILQILRTPPCMSPFEFMDHVHPIWLEERFVSNGLTLTEHRALQYYLRGLKQKFRGLLTFTGEEVFADTRQNMYKRKYEWLQNLENVFKEALAKEGTKEAMDYTCDYGFYNPDDNDTQNGTDQPTKAEVLEKLGQNEIHSKMMQDWLDKPSSSKAAANDDNNDASKPAPPRLPMGNLLLGIQKKSG